MNGMVECSFGCLDGWPAVPPSLPFCCLLCVPVGVCARHWMDGWMDGTVCCHPLPACLCSFFLSLPVLVLLFVVLLSIAPCRAELVRVCELTTEAGLSVWLYACLFVCLSVCVRASIYLRAVFCRRNQPAHLTALFPSIVMVGREGGLLSARV